MRLIMGLVILFFSVWLGLKIAEDPGLALFTYRDWSIEMPLWFAVLSLFLLLLVVYFVVRFWDKMDLSLYRWRSWVRFRRKNKSHLKTNRGLLELIEGRWRAAESHLLAGIEQSDTPLMNYLAAARAAHAQEAYAKRDEYLQKAHEVATPQTSIVVGLIQAELQLAQGQLEQVLATLYHLRTLAPAHREVLRLTYETYMRLQDWPALLTLLPHLRKSKVISILHYDELEQTIYYHLITEKQQSDLESWQAFWRTVPSKLQKNPRIVYAYVKQIHLYPAAVGEIEELIQRVLKKNWDIDLVHLYGMLLTAQPKKQLATAEKWLKLYPQQPILLLTLGRLCMRCQVWGKARHYLEESLQLEKNPETYAEYGKLLEQIGNATAAIQAYRAGLASVQAE